MASNKKIVRSTQAQLRYMIDFMTENPDLIRSINQYTAGTPYNMDQREAKWLKLKYALREYGNDKSVEKWKHTWRDLKKSARMEQRKISQAESNGQVLQLSNQAQAVIKALKNRDIYEKNLDGVSHNTFDNTCDIDDDEDDGGDGSDIEAMGTTVDIERLSAKSAGKQGNTNHSNAQAATIMQELQDPLVYEVEDDGDSGSHKVEEVLTFPDILHNEPEPKKKRYRRSRTSSSGSSANINTNKFLKSNHFNGSCAPDSDNSLLNTLNNFIEYEKEKERLTHEREMCRMAQQGKMLNLFQRIVSVVEDLAPSVKKCLNRKAET